MDGILIINKHKGCTSHDIVHKIKKITKEKVGHTGTLDPMATGVLPLLIGKGTLCSKYLINHDKIYEVKLQLGKRTDTLDAEGKVVEEKMVSKSILEELNVKKVLLTFLGKQEQFPPIYSAIKVNGKKLYEYARMGKTVEIKPRQIEIYKVELNNIELEEKTICFTVSCSKGTYIRSLCEQIAVKLGTIGYMCDLKRLQVGDFNISDSITLEELQNNQDDIKEYIIPIERLFQNNGSIELTDKKLQLFLNGVQLTMDKQDGIYKIYNNNKFIGIGIIKNSLLKRDIIL